MNQLMAILTLVALAVVGVTGLIVYGSILSAYLQSRAEQEEGGPSNPASSPPRR